MVITLRLLPVLLVLAAGCEMEPELEVAAAELAHCQAGARWEVTVKEVDSCVGTETWGLIAAGLPNAWVDNGQWLRSVGARTASWQHNDCVLYDRFEGTSLALTFEPNALQKWKYRLSEDADFPTPVNEDLYEGFPSIAMDAAVWVKRRPADIMLGRYLVWMNCAPESSLSRFTEMQSINGMYNYVDLTDLGDGEAHEIVLRGYTSDLLIDLRHHPLPW